MFSSKKIGATRQRMVLYLPVRAIKSDPQKPRRAMDAEELRSLSDSIRLYGVLQPLTVRKKEAGWELVAGERRLRAARMAGLQEVPCLVAEDGPSGLSTQLEQLTRRNLPYLEQARGIRRLMAEYGLGQEQVAQRLGMSQSAVANKLRLLKHPPEILTALEETGLSERHARALLRENDPHRRMALLQEAAHGHWSAARLEQALAEPHAETGTLQQLLASLRQTAKAAGVEVCTLRQDTATEYILTLRLITPTPS